MVRSRSLIYFSVLSLAVMHSASGMPQGDAPPAGVTIDTVAGGAFPSSLPAQNLLLQSIGGIAWDGAGNLVYCDTAHDAIRRIHPNGTVDTIVGTGQTGFAGDGGPATSALLNQPQGPRYDAAGNLYFWDSQNFRVRRIDTQGTIFTVAGNGIPYATGQDLTGPVALRSLTSNLDIAIDAAGNVYLDEPALNAIRRVTPAGQLQLFAGTGTATCSGCPNGDGGPATAATLYQPSNVVSDRQGNIYIEDGPGFVAPGPSIRKVSSNGVITTFWKATVTTNSDLGITIYNLPAQLAADPTGRLYALYNGIVLLNSDGTMTTIAGGIPYSAGASSSPDGPAVPSVIYPSSLTADAQGNVAFIDDVPGGNPAELREVTPQSMLKTLAGASPTTAPDGTGPRSAWFLNPNSLALDHNGNLYIAESLTCMIRKIDLSGVLSTFAGTGKCAYPSPPGTAQGNLSPVGSLAFDSQNRLWVADFYLNLYRINLDGTITFYATRTPVSGTTGQIAIDNKDRLYVLGLNSIYRILSDGTTLQAVVLPPESGGTGKPGDLRGLGTDPSGNTYFGSLSAVYRVNDDATFSLVYNSGVGSGFAVDAAGKVWTGNCFVSAAGSGCLGSGVGFSGDGGLAQQARIGGSQSLFAPNGNLYMLATDRVREIVGLGASIATPAISAGGVVNALSYAGGAVATGEIVSIFGSNFASNGVNAPVNNAIPTVLGRTKVMIGSQALPLLAVTPNQINAIVPYLPSETSVSVAVQVDGALSPAVSLPLAATAPGLATSDSSGAGQGAILNQDGSVNSRANPAVRGSFISLFGAGAGVSMPQIPLGALALATPYPIPQANVTVTIGGQAAPTQYAGAAPYLTNGVFQINAQVPANIPPGESAVVVTIGGVSTPQSVTVAVQ